jgi:photosystem II CP47 chlorophyll apoprotein
LVWHILQVSLDQECEHLMHMVSMVQLDTSSRLTQWLWFYCHTGFLGILVALWHISARPTAALYKLFRMDSLESALASNLPAIFVSAFVNAATMWYGAVTTPIELFGPTRYQWDNDYFSTELGSRVRSTMSSSSASLTSAWSQIPDKLVLYDYLGTNPSKGGLFRSGPMNKSDGIVQNWTGHPSFGIGTVGLSVRRMPAFFETFPVLLVDNEGLVRADIPFRRAESHYSIEQQQVTLQFAGGILSGTSYTRPSAVKAYARKAQFGEIFTFDQLKSLSDGVFRTSPRGWYSFSHLSFAFIFFFGHLWHAGRSLFQDIWTGVRLKSLESVEYGRNEKLGDY